MMDPNRKQTRRRVGARAGSFVSNSHRADGRRTTKNENTMPQGDKSSYTKKQKRQAQHIEKGYEKRGVSTKTAEKRAWATVNKLTGGGRKSGAGRRTHTRRSSKP
jgi:hypothetical protein